MMSRIPNYPTDDNDAVFSSSSLSSEHYHHDSQPTRLSSSSSSSSSSRRDSLPPTRTGQVKPGDVVDPLRLVKAETNPLANKAMETISAIEKQKHSQKETKKADCSDVDWEQNLSSWKDRRKSKPTYQPKALEVGEEQEDPMASSTAGGKRSKTFNELMDEKEKRSNGLGLYTYEGEASSGISRDTSSDSSRDAAAVTPMTSKTPISSTVVTTAAPVTDESKVLDPTISDASRQSSVLSHKREFYFTDSLVEGVSRDLKTSQTTLPTSSGNLEAGTLLVQQRPQEISVEFKTPTETSAPETKVLIQKTSTAIESADSGSDSERKPWRSTDSRRASALTSGPSTNSAGVTLRDKPAGGAQQPRPSSYAFTGYSSDTRSAKPEVSKPPMRPPSGAAVAAQVRGSSTRRESAGGGVGRPLPDRQVNPPPPPGALTRDRRVKSNWELNFSQSFEKSDRQEFRHPHPPPPPPQQQQQQRSAEASSSAKFKQALSLFQSKEAEAGRPPPQPPSKAALTTHRASLGGSRTTSARLPTDEPPATKPIRATAGGTGGVDTKRPLTATTSASYGSSTETRTSRETGETRPRDWSRSVHGGGGGGRLENDADAHLLDRGIPDRRRSMFDRGSKYDDNDDDKYEWKKKGNEKPETSYQRSNFESDYSTVDKSAPPKDTDKAKNAVTTRVENASPEVSVLRSRVEMSRDTSAPADDEGERIGVGSTVSWTLKLGTDPSPGKAPVDISYDQGGAFPEHVARRRSPGIQSGAVQDEGRTRDGKNGSISVPDWRMDQRRDSLNRAQLADSNEPKSLYAFKYQTSNAEESIVEGRDKIPTKAATDFKTTSYVERPSDTKGNLIETEGAATKSRDPTEWKDSYKMEEDSFSESNSRQWNKQNQQQQSISDIFSRRSADAVRVRSEPDEPVHRPFINAAPSAMNTERDEQKYRKEVEISRREDSTKFDAEIKPDGERHDGERRTKNDVMTDTQRFVGDVTTAGFHDDRTSQKAEPEVRGLERTYGESGRRRYGLGRYDYAEEDRGPAERGKGPEQALHEPNKEATQHYNLTQESAFEVNFSSFGLEKKSSTGGGIEADKDRLIGKTERRFDGSLLLEPSSEAKFERNEKTSKESSPGDHKLILTDDRLRSPHEDFILEESINSLASDMKSVELDSSAPFQVNSNESINLSRSSNGVLTLSFTEAEVELQSPETKSRRGDDSADFIGGDSPPPNKPRNSGGAAASEAKPRWWSSLAEDGSSPSSPSAEALPSPVPPPLPLEKPPNFPVDPAPHSPSFEFSFALPPPSRRMPSPEPVSPEPVLREPASQEPASREPVSLEPVSPKPVSREPALREPVLREPVSREPVSREPVSREPVSPKPVLREPVLREPVLREPVSQEPVLREPASPERNTYAEKLIGFGADDKIGLSELSKRDSMSEKSLTKTEIVSNDDDDDHKGFSVDGNSNIHFDRTPIHSLPPANIPQQQSPTVSLSLDQKTHDSKVASLSPTKEQQKTNYNASSYSSDESPSKVPQQSNEDTSSAEVTSSVKISPNNPPPQKKKPPEVPKTKPKPKIPQKSGDDWGFLATTQLLDTSANRDKCRLAREGPMAVKKRPKSAFIPSLDTKDLFDISNGGHRENESIGVNGYREDAIDGRDGATTRDLDRSAGKSEEAVSLRSKASLKGTRPVSYMGELNSSLAKKFKGVSTTPDEGKEERNRGDQLKGVSIGNAFASDESSSSSRYGELEAVDSSESMLIRPRARGSVKMPGLMNELNLSLKKKFQDNPQETTGRETTEHSILRREDTEEKAFRNDATANSLKSTVANDDDDDERDADVPPPPLPNAPPPLPNWNSFPGDSSPAGLPPLPPSGPPPALIDFRSSGEEEEEDDDDSGKIQFRVDESAIRRQAHAPDQKWWQPEESEKTDEMDFSYA